MLAWHDALNERDLDTLIALSSDDIEVGDAEGAVQGHDALVEWADSLDGAVEPGRMYVRDGVVVVEHSAGAWAFRVVRDHVTSVFRHGDLASALAATELTDKDLAG